MRLLSGHADPPFSPSPARSSLTATPSRTASSRVLSAHSATSVASCVPFAWRSSRPRRLGADLLNPPASQFFALMFRFHTTEGYAVAWLAAGAFAAGLNLLCILIPTPKQ